VFTYGPVKDTEWREGSIHQLQGQVPVRGRRERETHTQWHRQNWKETARVNKREKERDRKREAKF
jgi:hypothetical protein